MTIKPRMPLTHVNMNTTSYTPHMYSVANITSVDQLSGAEVSATDLRASMALIIAALAAKGRTVIDNTHHIDRGYEAFEEKLSRCGAKIYRIVA